MSQNVINICNGDFVFKKAVPKYKRNTISWCYWFRVTGGYYRLCIWAVSIFFLEKSVSESAKNLDNEIRRLAKKKLFLRPVKYQILNTFLCVLFRYKRFMTVYKTHPEKPLPVRRMPASEQFRTEFIHWWTKFHTHSWKYTFTCIFSLHFRPSVEFSVMSMTAIAQCVYCFHTFYTQLCAHPFSVAKSSEWTVPYFTIFPNQMRDIAWIFLRNI